MTVKMTFRSGIHESITVIEDVVSLKAEFDDLFIVQKPLGQVAQQHDYNLSDMERFEVEIVETDGHALGDWG